MSGKRRLRGVWEGTGSRLYRDHTSSLPDPFVKMGATSVDISPTVSSSQMSHSDLLDPSDP